MPNLGRSAARVAPPTRRPGGRHAARWIVLLALAGTGCDRLGLPTTTPLPPEPAFLWGLCNPAEADEVAALAGGNPFLVRLDSPFTGGRPTLRSARTIERLRVHPGVRFMVVLPFRPDGSVGPDAWSEFVAHAVEYYGRLPQVRYLQITQGINQPVYADVAGDRAPFARQALLDGLRTAHAARARTGADLRIGFSVYVGTGTTPEALFTWLGRSPEVAQLVDWVGLDCYPGSGLLCLESGAGEALGEVVRRTRRDWLPLAGLGDTPLLLTRLGVSTILQVSPDAQGRWVHALTDAVWSLREDLDVRACCWYEARDKDSTATVLRGPGRYVASHFGLSTSGGWRKEGFHAYGERVAALQLQPHTGTMIK